jgi:multiple sugar transport system substrate-binding protein
VVTIPKSASRRADVRRRIGRRAVAALAASSLGAAGLLAAGGSVASAASSGKHVTITFASWADDTASTVPGIQAAEKLYEQKNPNVTIVNQPFSYSTLGSRVLLEVRSGHAPTVAETQGNYTAAFAATGQLVPLKSFAKKEVSNLLKPAVKEGTYTKKFLALPWVVAPFGFWYNKKLMNEAGITSPPSTITQLKTDLQKVRAKFPASTGVVPFGFDTTNRSYGLDQSWSFMQDFGATPFTAKGTGVHVTTKHFLDYLTFIRFLGTNNYDIPNDLTGHFRPLAADTEVVFDIDGPYFVNDIRSTNHETATQFYANWGVTTLPAGPTKKHYTVPTDHQLVMFKTAKNKAASWKFMNWLATSATAIKNYSIPVEGSLPPLKTAAKAYAKTVSNPVAESFRNTIEPTAITPPWGTRYGDAYPAIMAGVQSAMTSSTPLPQIASTIQSKLQTALAGSAAPG